MTSIALVGKPNVGKSSLFNRLAGFRDAITSDIAGTTRDIKRREIEIEGKPVMLYDTGGLEERDSMFKVVRRHAIRAAEEADIVLFMVDGKEMPDDEDRKLFFELQDKAKSIALVINKIDNEKLEENIYDYMAFGAEHLFTISVSHNRCMNALLGWLDKRIEDPNSMPFANPAEDDLMDLLANYDEEGQLIEEKEDGNEAEDSGIRVAILGRPNVGKSSLLNALIGEERSVVSEIAGTTIDPVDESIEHNGKEITFVDTAGIRRRSKIEGIEKFALGRSRKMLEQADLAILVLDASSDLTELDERIGGMIEEFNLGCIVVLNKYDVCEREYEELMDDINYRFKYLSHAPKLTLSALTKKRIHKLWDVIHSVYNSYAQRLPTSQLNRLIEVATIRHQLPSDHGKIVRIYYATQYETKPPQIALVSNRPRSIHFSYLRYLENRLREAFELTGTPIILTPRAKRRNSQDEGETSVDNLDTTAYDEPDIEPYDEEDSDLD